MGLDVQCPVCNEVFAASDRQITCSDCGSGYHTGNCAGITENTLKTKGESYRKAWRCATCRRSKSQLQLSQKPADEPEVQDIRIWLKTINNKLDHLLPLKETVESMEDSIQFMSEKFDDLLKRTEKNERDVLVLKRRVEMIERREGETDQLSSEVDNLEWRSRRLNLEFHGLQQTAREDLLGKINEIAAHIELPQLVESDVVAIHRLPSRRDKIPVVICRFATQAKRDLWWQNKNKIRSSGNDSYVMENLTKRTRDLLFETKNWAKSNNFKYVWHSNGRVLVRKIDGERPLVISSVYDLEKL